jgi:transketolase
LQQQVLAKIAPIALKIAKTIAHGNQGIGIDFMEKNFTWHGKPPNKEELKIALGELRTLGGKIKSE